ncbi:hypothetical protein BIV60_11280 [Bacillus sp. MUM 116]|uniref:hypothetical protein n=1 Tax=Bacillus sp. MUM 116 TaxID=1678002 RepID=UPI0008F5E628|nr:hypothetical protein [Bacillus sp. MUM 116]OIK14616.1 hypothetical protein BIV60_11280 [Bacillus sp. MUM 116]
MVTLSFILINVFLTGLLALFDMKLFEYNFLEAVRGVLFSEIAAGRYIVLVGVIIGFIASIVIDIRIYISESSPSPPQTGMSNMKN